MVAKKAKNRQKSQTPRLWGVTLTFKMSRGQKVTRKKILDSLDLHTCQISSNSIGGFSRSATGHAFPYWGKITTRARRGPTQLAKLLTGKKNPQPPRIGARVVKMDSRHPDDRRATARQRTFERGQRFCAFNILCYI